MAKPVFKHQEDDGDLSIFASSDVLVVACEHGHYWVLNAEQQSSESLKPALEDALPMDQAQELFRMM
jgi:hypothetical protein